MFQDQARINAKTKFARICKEKIDDIFGKYNFRSITKSIRNLELVEYLALVSVLACTLSGTHRCDEVDMVDAGARALSLAWRRQINILI